MEPKRKTPLPSPVKAEFITAKEAAQYLHLSESKVWAMLAEGLIPRYKFGSKTTRIKIDDLAAYTAAQGARA